jgi:hypothetical protein
MTRRLLAVLLTGVFLIGMLGGSAEAGKKCHRSYRFNGVCIRGGADLDCDQVPYSNFKVVGSDPHGFDGDNDGRGCES